MQIDVLQVYFSTFLKPLIYWAYHFLRKNFVG
nr:unnamed protein product [Callosobruchus chinensis]